MAIETAHGQAPPEAYEAHFEHDTQFHQLQDAIFNDWQERGLPLRMATPREDEEGSLRSTRGFDHLLSNKPIDLTASFKKYNQETLQPSSNQEKDKIVVHVPLSKREFQGKSIEEILQDPKLFNELSRETMRNLFLSLSPKEAELLAKRLESRIGANRK